jgi:hypothetical protein
VRVAYDAALEITGLSLVDELLRRGGRRQEGTTRARGTSSRTMQAEVTAGSGIGSIPGRLGRPPRHHRIPAVAAARGGAAHDVCQHSI